MAKRNEFVMNLKFLTMKKLFLLLFTSRICRWLLELSELWSESLSHIAGMCVYVCVYVRHVRFMHWVVGIEVNLPVGNLHLEEHVR